MTLQSDSSNYHRHALPVAPVASSVCTDVCISLADRGRHPL